MGVLEVVSDQTVRGDWYSVSERGGRDRKTGIILQIQAKLSEIRVVQTRRINRLEGMVVSAVCFSP